MAYYLATTSKINLKTMKTMNKILTVAALMLVTLAANAQEVVKAKQEPVKTTQGKPAQIKKKSYAKKNVKKATSDKHDLKTAPKKD